jgi:hypothetical protein
MSEAFNEMHRRCQTPYFVQVDGDMILKEGAITRLYEGIRRTGFFTYAVYGQLYEEGFGPGGTVRCWKRDFFRWFQFRDVRTVDRDLFRRAAWFGFRRGNLNVNLGTHRPRHSLFSEYLKSKSDVEKWRFLKRPARRYALPLLEELLRDPQENRCRIFGALLGGMTSWERVCRSKDVRLEEERLRRVLDLLGWKDLQALRLCEGCVISGELSARFASAYRDRRGGISTELTGEVARIFSSGGQVDCSALCAEIIR